MNIFCASARARRRDPPYQRHTPARVRCGARRRAWPGADREAITVLNNARFARGTDIQQIFAQLQVNDAAHAFYLGKELARASLAVTLGKTYRQEGALSWGYLTPPDDRPSEHVRLSQRTERIRNDPNAPDANRGREPDG